MEILLNPNVAYLILVFGLVITVLAILSPGTGLLEAAALLILGLVAWEVINLSFNLWALILLIIGVVLFLLALYRPAKNVFLILSIIALVVGSAFLFPSGTWYQPGVNPLLALVTSVLLAAFFWVATHKILEARKAPPVQTLEAVIGASGEARTDIHDEGTVQIGSELWSAHSTEHIRRGAMVRVTGRNGFVLEVIATDQTSQQEADI
jgi:membrane-bound serine protease (ClpP class)